MLPATPSIAPSIRNSRVTCARVTPSVRNTPISRRSRSTDNPTALRIRNSATNTVTSDSAVRLSANAATRFSTWRVRARGSSAVSPAGSARASAARTASRRSGSTRRSMRSSVPIRPNTSCAVAMSATITLPPSAWSSASDCTIPRTVSVSGRPETRIANRSPTRSLCRPAKPRVTATARGSSSAASRRCARGSSSAAARSNGASRSGSRPRTRTASAAEPAGGTTGAHASTIGVTASVPASARTRGNTRSSNGPDGEDTCRFARPVTASTLWVKDPSAERFATRTLTNTPTPSATPATVSSVRGHSRIIRRSTNQRISGFMVRRPVRPAARSCGWPPPPPRRCA